MFPFKKSSKSKPVIEYGFEYISNYSDEDFPLPEKGTDEAAGYDMYVAEDTVIPSYYREMAKYTKTYHKRSTPLTLEVADSFYETNDKFSLRPTLIPLGVKWKGPENKNACLKLYARSSCPLKYMIVAANSVAVIDSDYYNNDSNEGHIYFQAFNFGPEDIVVRKGERICQGVIEEYLTSYTGESRIRSGGMGSTSQGAL